MNHEGFRFYFFFLLLLANTAFAAKSFVYCSEGSPSTFNPQLATDGSTFNATKTVYSRLVRFKYGETEILPDLAESWDISKDGKSYTFHLRRNVSFHSFGKFSPTRDFNADDVLFSFNRQRLKDHPFHAVGNAAYEYFNSMEMGKIIKDIVKVDASTVRFELNSPTAPFLADLAMDFASILSAEYADFQLKKGTPEKMDFEPVGTGPFIFIRYDKDQTIRFQANPNYYGTKAKIEKLSFSITQDASVRFQKLRTNECQLITEPSPADLEKMKKDPKLKVMEKPGLNIGYLAFNVEKKPLDNVLVRRAIYHALNRNAYIDAIYLGHAIVAKNPFPPTIWGYNQKTVDPDYNPEKAKALLKQAGLANGFSTDLWTLPVSRPYNPNGKKMGEMMQADLAKVGIKVRLVTYDWPTYLEKTRHGEHSLVQMGWVGDNGDPDNFLGVLLNCAGIEAGSNLARWCNKPFDALVTKAKITSNREARIKLYEQAQTLFTQEVPWVPLAHAVTYRSMAKNVTGYLIDPFGSDDFHYVDLQ
jgi:dipeptide transport system substrate-binding protein